MALVPFAALTDTLMSSPHQGLKTPETWKQECLGAVSTIFFSELSKNAGR